MSHGWREVCSRGEFDLAVLTRARALRESLPVAVECAFLGFILRDDEREAVGLTFASIASVRAFVARLEPRGLSVFGTEGEDRAAIAAAIREFAPTLRLVQ